jgi:hypothetical protein
MRKQVSKIHGVEQVLPQEESTPGKPIFAPRRVTCEAKRRRARGRAG